MLKNGWRGGGSCCFLTPVLPLTLQADTPSTCRPASLQSNPQVRAVKASHRLCFMKHLSCRGVNAVTITLPNSSFLISHSCDLDGSSSSTCYRQAQHSMSVVELLFRAGSVLIMSRLLMKHLISVSLASGRLLAIDGGQMMMLMSSQYVTCVNYFKILFR